MAESSTQADTRKENGSKNTLELLSGADPEVISQLSEKEKNPYKSIGLLTIIASVSIGISGGLFFYELLHNTIVAIFFGFILLGIFALLLRAMNERLLGTRANLLLVVCFLLAPLISILFSIPIATQVAEPFHAEAIAFQYAKDTAGYTRQRDSILKVIRMYTDSASLLKNSDGKTQRYLDSLRIKIDKDRKDSSGLSNRIRSNNIQLKKLQEYRGDPKDYSQNQAALPIAEIKNLQAKTANLENALKIVSSELRKSRQGYSFYSSNIGQISAVRDSFVRRYTMLAAADSVLYDTLSKKIISNRQQIETLQNDRDCNCTFMERFNYFNQNKWTNSSIKIMFLASAILMFLVLSAILLLTITTRNDLYHQLAEEKKKSASMVREQITNRFKFQQEISQTKQSYSQGDEDSKEIANQLSSVNDPGTLVTLGETLLESGNSTRAKDYFEQAIALDKNYASAWKNLAEVYRLINDPAKEKQARERYIEVYAEQQFKTNLSQQISIRSIELSNLPFYGSFTWHLRKNINVLLGKNGYGKSHLMSLLLAQLQEEEKKLREYSLIDSGSPTRDSPYMKIKLDSVPARNSKQISELNSRITVLIEQRNAFLSKAESEQTDKETSPETHTEWDDEIRKLHSDLEFAEGISYYDRLGLRSTFGKIPVLAIPDSRFINKSASSTSSVNDERAARLLENGAYHFIFDIPFESAIQNFLNIISDIYRDDGKKFSDEVFLLISRVFKRLTGQEFEWRRIDRNEVGSGNIILVRTEGTTVDLPIQKVSQGTLSVISMMGLLYHYLSLRYPDVPRNMLTNQHAIVFIDEIDAHLHPNWQQKMTSLLRSEFPNIQFIITAHSPLIITGCKEEEVSVLRKTADSRFSIHTIMTDLIGKPIADIYRIIFEIEEKDEMYLKIVALLPFKNAIEEKATELRKKKRTPAEEKQMEEMEQQMENFIYLEQFESLRSSQEEKNMLLREKQDLLKENTLLKAEVNTLRNPLNTDQAVKKI